MNSLQRHRLLWLSVIVMMSIVLIGLAALQYHWSKRLTEVIKERIETSLKASAMDWHFGLVRGVAEPCFAMQISSDRDSEQNFNNYIRRYAEWRQTATWPTLFPNLYLIKISPKGRLSRVFRLENGRLIKDQLSPKFANLEKELERQSANPEVLERASTDDPRTKSDNPGAMPRDPLFGWQFESNLPALIHPLMRSDVLSDRQDRRFHEGGLASDRMAENKEKVRDHDRDEENDHDADNENPIFWIVIELDSKVLQQQVLPELTQHYFGGPQGANFDYAVVAEKGERILYTSDPSFKGSLNDADLVLNVFGPPPTGQAVLSHDFAGDFRAGGATKPTTSEERRKLAAPMWFPVMQDIGSSGDWNLIVKHRAGSLDDQMAAMRRRDFTINSAVLLLLGVTIAMLIIATRRAQRLAQLQVDFVATVSHELRTPLAVICSAADNLSDGVVQGEQQVVRYGETIRAQGKQLIALVERILQFASTRDKRQLYNLELLEIKNLIDLVLRNTAGVREGAQVHTEIDVEPHLPLIIGDVSAISQCIQNLIINAVKYGGEAKWLKITAHRVETSTKCDVQIAVEDHGIGIARSDLSHIFEPFYRSQGVASDIHGTGLGLALAKTLAEAMAGSLTVESEIGKGSVFTLHLPAAENSPLLVNAERVEMGA